MANRLLYTIPPKGSPVPAYVCEYSETEWTSGQASSPAICARLDRGEVVIGPDGTLVELIAHARMTLGLDRIAGLS